MPLDCWDHAGQEGESEPIDDYNVLRLVLAGIFLEAFGHFPELASLEDRNVNYYWQFDRNFAHNAIVYRPWVYKE